MTSYDVVADEYYTVGRHPTCDNFRTASAMVISSWLRDMSKDALVCEVGAGKSIVAGQLVSLGRPLNRLLITDQTPTMLEYSREFESAGATLKVADADRLPIDRDGIDCLVSSLGDPYNTEEFWVEVHRVLKPNGTVMFTTPAYDWAKSFRMGTSDSQTILAEAEFDLAGGRRVRLPSFIHSDADQQQLIEKCGLTVRDVVHTTIGDLNGQVLSPKLCLDRGPRGAVVTGFLAKK